MDGPYIYKKSHHILCQEIFLPLCPIMIIQGKDKLENMDASPVDSLYLGDTIGGRQFNHLALTKRHDQIISNKN